MDFDSIIAQISRVNEVEVSPSPASNSRYDIPPSLFSLLFDERRCHPQDWMLPTLRANAGGFQRTVERRIEEAAPEGAFGAAHCLPKALLEQPR